MKDKKVENSKQNTKNQSTPNKKFDGKILAIILLMCGVVALFGVAIGISIASTNEKPKTPTNSSTQLGEEWTNNY